MSDTTAPTVTIDPANGTTNVPVGSNITITFNEEVRNLNDTPLTNTNVDTLITLKDTDASGADIPFDATIDADNKVITINPTSDFSADQVIYVSIGATVEDTYGNAITAASATMTTGSSLPSQAPAFEDPRVKEDVIGNIQAWSGMAERWTASNLNILNYRLDWLRRNHDADDRPYFDMTINSANPIAGRLIQAASSGGQQASSAAGVVSTLQNQFGIEEEARGPSGAALADMAISQAVQTAQSKVLGDADQNLASKAFSQAASWLRTILGGWSLWSQGDAAFGKIRSRGDTPEQDIDGSAVFIGMDRPIYGSGLFGFAAGYGEGDTDVGSMGSGVETDNYSVSGYTALPLPFLGGPALEATLGYGRMDMAITRIDGSQILTGARDADQIFGSAELQSRPIFFGDLSFSPYSRVEASYTQLDSFSETGGSLALVFARQRLNTVMAFVGADAAYDLRAGGMDLRPFAKAEYGVDLSGDSDVAMRYALDSTDYRYTLDGRPTSSWRAGIGLDIQLKAGTSISFVYFRTQNTDSDYLNNFDLKASVSF